MNRLTLILIFCLSVTARAETYSSPAGINAQFALMATSGSGLDGQKAIGGTVQVTAGTWDWKDKSVSLSSGMTLDGVDKARCRVIFRGPPGTAAIYVYANADNGWVSDPQIKNLQIDCVAGGAAVMKIASAKWVNNLHVDNVYATGGMLFPGENYRCVFNGCDFRVTNQQALLIEGQQNVIRRCQFGGTVDNPKIEAVVDISGSALFDDFCGIEGAFNVTALRVRNWYQVRGLVAGDIEWHEAKAGRPIGPWLRVIKSDYHTTAFGGTDSWFAQLDDGGLYLASPANAGAVKGTGTLHVMGKPEQTIGSVP